MTITLGVIAVLLFAIFLWPIAIGGAPYVATPPETIRRALRLAMVRPGDTVFDLGCGDGRVLRMAAREYGAIGVGIELNPFWVWWARWRSRGLPITVRWKELGAADLTDADVIYLFLAPTTMLQVVDLLTGLKTGVRIVSYGFVLPPEWTPILRDDKCYLYISGEVIPNELQ